MSPDPRRYAPALWLLLAFFVLRVAGQLLIAFGYGDFLPPWEEWFSGLVPYSQLLASQVVIVIVFTKVCIDFTRRRGHFVVPRSWLGTGLLTLGSVYLSVMVLRYMIRMSLYPLERWTGGSIPIFFHWVLASFLLVAGAYHRKATHAARPGRAIVRTGVALSWVAIVLGVSLWVAYQLAPTLLASILGARRAEYAVRIERGAAMTTRDGVTLVADVYHPVRADTTPTILVRIPFSKTVFTSFFATVVGRFWAERGYTVVIQGTRGRYQSGGRHYPLIHERADGLDTLDWLERQRWFDGRLGMWGGSAFGHTQWAIADRLPSPPAGRSALMVQICSTDVHGMFYPGGAFSLSSALFWALRSRGSEDERPGREALERGFNTVPLINADDRAAEKNVGFFDDWVNHATRDAYWSAIDGEDRRKTLQAPVMLMAGWFDPFLPGQLADFVAIRQNASSAVAAETRLVIGPWGHAETVRLPDGVTARNYRLDSLAPSLPWFDRHLRSLTTRVQDPPVRLFVMGANTWRDEQEWPLARARDTSWYLRSGGHANSLNGDGRLSTEQPGEEDTPDVFLADPSQPVPTRGGATLGYGAGVFPQNEVESRNDVLVYSTPILTEAVEVTGPVTVTLYVATSAPNADFTAKLVDVDRDGVAYNVSDGIIRQAFPPHNSPASAEPRRIDVRLWPTSMVFLKGHRIRLEIAGSNFPRFDRNPQTGASIATATTSAPATHAVFHGRMTPSRMVLPVVPNTP